MKCIYHDADYDGVCSAAIVKNNFSNCELFGTDHGRDFDFSSFEPGETVFCCDFSFDVETMMYLEKTFDFIWCDHHISKIRDMQKAGIKPKGMRSTDYSGCELTWMYINKKCWKEMPYSIKLLGRYDVWKIDFSKDVMPFQYKMRAMDFNPDDQNVWKQLFSDNKYEPGVLTQSFINDGFVISPYVDYFEKMYSEKYSFDVNFEGHTCKALNIGKGSSRYFRFIENKNDYDIWICFVKTKNKWCFSLYGNNKNIDVSELAKKFGGGGHEDASGFSCSKLPFEIL